MCRDFLSVSALTIDKKKTKINTYTRQTHIIFFKYRFKNVKIATVCGILPLWKYFFFTLTFYPTALKGCRGIVFTHGVQMGGRAGRWREIVCVGSLSETVRCRKFILGRDIGCGV